MYSSGEIKEQFLNFFVKNGHFKIDGSSVIPKNDPTLLYINAGMAAIKNYFTGDEPTPDPTPSKYPLPEPFTFVIDII